MATLTKDAGNVPGFGNLILFVVVVDDQMIEKEMRISPESLLSNPQFFPLYCWDFYFYFCIGSICVR